MVCWGLFPGGLAFLAFPKVISVSNTPAMLVTYIIP